MDIALRELEKLGGRLLHQSLLLLPIKYELTNMPPILCQDLLAVHICDDVCNVLVNRIDIHFDESLNHKVGVFVVHDSLESFVASGYFVPQFLKLILVGVDHSFLRYVAGKFVCAEIDEIRDDHLVIEFALVGLGAVCDHHLNYVV